MRVALAEAGFSANAPAISQETMIDALGLGMSKAALRKQLQILAADDQTQIRARALKLTAASMRALLTLEPDAQQTLLTALEADPVMVRQVRSIIEGVRSKGRTIDDAIMIAQGRVPGIEPATASLESAEPAETGEQPAEASVSNAAEPGPGPGPDTASAAPPADAVDWMALQDQVITTTTDVYAVLDALQAAQAQAASCDTTTAELLTEALTLLRDALRTLPTTFTKGSSR
jgi:hypothetical protein